MYLPLAAVVVLLTLLGYAVGRRQVFVRPWSRGGGIRRADHPAKFRLSQRTKYLGGHVARQPQSSRGHSSLGVALAGIPGRIPDALAQCEEALRLKPDSFEAHHSFAIVLAKIPGRLPDALAQCEAALRLKPNYAEAHNSLGIVLAENTRPFARRHRPLRSGPASQTRTWPKCITTLAWRWRRCPAGRGKPLPATKKLCVSNQTMPSPTTNLANVLAKVPGQLPRHRALRGGPAPQTRLRRGPLQTSPWHWREYRGGCPTLSPTMKKPCGSIRALSMRVTIWPQFMLNRRLEAAIDQLEIAAGSTRHPPWFALISGKAEGQESAGLRAADSLKNKLP